MKVSVVIPALNEEGIVGKTVRSVPLKNSMILDLKRKYWLLITLL
jgi:glycosyltransferase involved in cell wall biosynthesis